MGKLTKEDKIEIYENKKYSYWWRDAKSNCSNCWETKTEIINKAKEINNIKVDVVEWRADFYEDVFGIEKVLDTLKDLSIILNILNKFFKK